MAKRIRLIIPTEIVVRDIDMKVLDVLDGASKGPGAAVSMTYRHLAEELQISARTAHRAVLSCVEHGFLLSSAERMASGAQIANTYQLTKMGLRVLTAFRALA